MSYKNILLAVDFSDESEKLALKAAEIAQQHQAKLYFIHVNINFSDLYSGLIEIDFEKMNEYALQNGQKEFEKLKQKVSYPIEKCIIATGDLGEVIQEAIADYNIDLLVVGHHRDFWSKFFSASKEMLKHANSDILVVPLKS